MQAAIYQITPFDATLGTTILFGWEGNQAFKNRCVIKRNDNQETVYDNTVESFKLEHVIDLTKARLTNGVWYNAFIVVYDKAGTASEMQTVGQPFLCLKTPVFQFVGLSPGQVFDTSSIDFTLTYSQENGELLDSWSITLYNQELTQTATSGVRYETGIMKHSFGSLVNSTIYAVRGEGKTVNGMPLDTGYIRFSISYDLSKVFSILELANIPQIAAIQLRSNIVSSLGHLASGKEPKYIDGEFLDIRDDELIYNEGFLLEGDFSEVAKFYGSKPNQTVMTLYGDDPEALTVKVINRLIKRPLRDINGQTAYLRNVLKVTADINAEDAKAALIFKDEEHDIDAGDIRNQLELYCTVFELRAVSYGVTYVRYSQKIPHVYPEDIVEVCVTREDGYFDIQAKNLERSW